MTKKSLLAKALGRRQDDGPASEPESELDAILAAIRDGAVPWDASTLPRDGRRATKLLFELDRVWLRTPG